MSLSRDQIFAARDFVLEPLEVPEWGGTVFIRTMSVAHQEAYMAELAKRQGGKEFTGLQCLLARYTVCGEDGALLFSDDDLPALNDRGFAAVSRVCDVAMRLNVMSKDAMEEAKGESAPGR